MTRLPPDQPDPEQPGPTIWAAREIRPDPRPTEGETFLSLASVVAAVLLGLALLAAWAFAK